MIKIVTIIGARPQIIKAAAISRCIKESFKQELTEIIVHTGQHYDENMSTVFFSEMNIPTPDYNLNVGSGSHAKQTAAMLQGIEDILVNEKPDYIVLYGDTNSTLAGAVAAAKIHIPVVHIEAGLRSFNKSMPEEINRIVCDHMSSLLFSPTPTGYRNLEKEGFNLLNTPPFHSDNPGVFHCGDVMYDNAITFAEIAEQQSTIIQQLNIDNNKYLLATIHRNNNTDDPIRLNAIFSAIQEISSTNNLDIVIPLHPRTSKILEKTLSPDLYNTLKDNNRIHIIPPVSFFDMITLEKNSTLVLTDSGGVQKEAYFYKKPCIIMRSETEWVEIVDAGAAIIANADKEKILDAFEHFKNNTTDVFPPIFGDGKASYFICKKIIENRNA